MYEIVFGFNVLNSAILLVLLYVFSRNYAHLRTRHNLGLMIFSFLFLLDNVLALVMGFAFWPCYNTEATGIVLIRRVTEFVGFSSLLYITWR